jgi:anhydro-N-acetylmuramic acid kinase
MESKWTVGMMSGTSMDGIDVAAIRTDGIHVFEVCPGLSVPYSERLREDLRSILGSTESSSKISKIEKKITEAHAAAFFKFLKTFSVPKESVDLIGFHGHSILHQPSSRFPVGRTWQIGDGALLAKLSDTDVVANMRANDVGAGGEGAPLVPLYHQALAESLEKPLAIVNIGGISNVTWLGKNNQILAFDMGPGNGLVDDWVCEHTREPFDAGGALAARGKVHEDRVEAFFRSPYFSKKPPKSLDRLDYSARIVEGLSLEDGAATLTEITAVAIEGGRKFFPESPVRWLLTGGGSHNKTLVQRIKHHLAPALVQKVEDVGWSGDFLEAQAWAFLAVRSHKGLPLTLPTTTGVSRELTGGEFFSRNSK